MLPVAIAARTTVAVSPISGSRSHATAGRRRQRGAFDPVHPTRSGAWWDYLAGVSAKLAERGVRVPPLAIAVSGEVPAGAGLSSSAALCVATAGAMSTAAGAVLPARDLADVAHRAEREYVGVECGIMDQYASALCTPAHALHLHCRSGESEQVPFAGSVLIFDTAEPRSLRVSRYNERRRECDRALEALRRIDRHLEWLADATPAMIASAHMDPILAQRARHVSSETLRVREAVRSLQRSGTIPGKLLIESHRSLRDDYECSTPALDWFVEQASRCEGVEGARLTGAGWGGCAIAIGEHGALGSVAADLAARFRRDFQRNPRWWVTQAQEGVREEVEDRAGA